jgi:dTDP-4-amino-4,6-dideoxygalactose transaminase
MGIKFKLIDVDKKLPNINLLNIKNNISKKTKAIIFVHFHGRMRFIEEISEFCKKKKIFLIEDSCKAILCKKNGKMAGTYGNFGCFSTGMISLINSGFGGFIVLNDKKFEKKIRMMKDHGSDRSNDTYPYLGLNFKTSDIYSSLIINQCKKKNLRAKEKKIRTIYNLYKKISNPKVSLMEYDNEEIPICIDVISTDILDLRKFLKKNKIPFCNLHRPFHESKFLGKKFKPTNYKNSKYFFKNCLMLPCGPDQNLILVKKTVRLINEKF